MPVIVLLVMTIHAIGMMAEHDCRSTASIIDYSLRGHTYKTIANKDIWNCILACDGDISCFSINYKFNSRLCELSDRTRVTRPSDFLFTPDTVYLEHLYRPSGSCFNNAAPCKYSGTCVNVPQRPGFKCFCRKDYSGDLCEVCNSPTLGISDGRIPDSQLSASSEGMWVPLKTYQAKFARLHGPSSWVAGLLDTKPYLQISLFPRVRLVTRIATQASPDHDWWTTSYLLNFSLKKINWTRYQVDGLDEVFLGNTDRNDVVSHNITSPFVAFYVRFYPLTKYFRSALRVELYGCDA